MSVEPPPKILYAKGADALYLYFVVDPKVAKSQNFTDDIVLDFDESGRLVGIEIIDFITGEHDIRGLVSRYGLDPTLPNDLETVRTLVKDPSVRRVSRELVLA